MPAGSRVRRGDPPPQPVHLPGGHRGRPDGPRPLEYGPPALLPQCPLQRHRRLLLRRFWDVRAVGGWLRVHLPVPRVPRGLLPGRRGLRPPPPPVTRGRRRAASGVYRLPRGGRDAAGRDAVRGSRRLRPVSAGRVLRAPAGHRDPAPVPAQRLVGGELLLPGPVLLQAGVQAGRRGVRPVPRGPLLPGRGPGAPVHAADDLPPVRRVPGRLHHAGRVPRPRQREALPAGLLLPGRPAGVAARVSGALVVAARRRQHPAVRVRARVLPEPDRRGRAPGHDDEVQTLSGRQFLLGRRAAALPRDVGQPRPVAERVAVHVFRRALPRQRVVHPLRAAPLLPRQRAAGLSREQSVPPAAGDRRRRLRLPPRVLSAGAELRPLPRGGVLPGRPGGTPVPEAPDLRGPRDGRQPVSVSPGVVHLRRRGGVPAVSGGLLLPGRQRRLRVPGAARRRRDAAQHPGRQRDVRAAVRLPPGGLPVSARRAHPPRELEAEL
eukprot:2254592-Rhodomonas_salina.1